MTANKYGNFLTILLVILIVAILVGAGLLVYNYVIKPRIEDNRSIEAIAEFDRNAEENNNEASEEEGEETLTNTIAPPTDSSNSRKKKKKAKQ